MSLYPRSASDFASAPTIDSERVTIPRIAVEVIAGPDRGLQAASRRGELSIGSVSSNHLVLADPAISRQHCIINATPDGILVRDLGSTSGTLLGGFRIQAAFIDRSARIQVGDTVLRIEVGEELVEAADVDAVAIGTGLHEVTAAAERSRTARGTSEPVAGGDVDGLDFTVSFRDAKERAVACWTATYVRELLARFDGNLSRAARTVAMDRNHLRDLLRKYVESGGAVSSGAPEIES